MKFLNQELKALDTDFDSYAGDGFVVTVHYFRHDEEEEEYEVVYESDKLTMRDFARTRALALRCLEQRVKQCQNFSSVANDD